MSRDVSADGGADLRLLRGLVDNVPSMLAYWDAELRCRFANRAYETWFGVSPSALLGTHISKLLGPLYSRNLPFIRGALRGEPQTFEREIPDPAGGLSRHSLAHYIPDRDANGAVRGFFVIVNDISEIKRIQLAQAAQEARFAAIIEMAGDAIISIDRERRITLFNGAAERIFGFDRADVLGADVGLLLPERLRERHRWHLAGIFADVSEVSRPMGHGMQTCGRRKDGSEFPVEAAISRVDVAGATLLTIVLRDVTERERIERQQQFLAEAGAVLASSLDYRETLRTITQLAIQHLGDLCIVDMLEPGDKLVRLAVTHVDPALADTARQLENLELDVDHVLATSALRTRQPHVFHDITPEFIAERARSPEHAQILYALGTRSAVVVPLLGRERTLGALVIGSRLPGQYGSRDVELATELARRAALAIENAQLYEAAQRASRARDDVLAIVAHDVRSPLNAITLAAQLLQRRLAREGVGDDEGEIASILRSVRRADRLIEDLLDVTRIDAGLLRLARTELDLAPIVREAATAHRALARELAVDLVELVDEPLPRVIADRDRVLQVLENLLGNAFAFTDEGGRIILRAAAPVAGFVDVSVTDTGCGIPAEKLPHVFDRFWQGQRTDRRGAGLGLAICKGIVEGYGGQIWAISEPGHGTTFTFRLPVVATSAE